MSVDIFWALVFILLAVGAPFVAKAVFDEADGVWMTFVGGGGRGPAVPMWLMFGMWCLIGVFCLAGAFARIALLSRRARAGRDRRELAPGEE